MCAPKMKSQQPVAPPPLPAPPVAVDAAANAAAKNTEEELRRRAVVGKAQKTGPGGIETKPNLAKNQLLGQ